MMFLCLQSLLKVNREKNMDIQKLLKVLSEILSEEYGIVLEANDL